jgi:hypothetical protein
MKRDAMLLVDALRHPESTASLDARGWTDLLTMARAEQLIGTLAARLKFESVPSNVAEILAEAQINAEYQRRSALWEADCARRALAGYHGKVVLLKGTAYVAAGLLAGDGRSIGDLDIMVAREDLPAVEAALIAAGWEWVKPDPYDDAYYRDHMHELPPLIHKERDRMIDVHHTILPLTARPTPDAAGMLDCAVALPLPEQFEHPDENLDYRYPLPTPFQPGNSYILSPHDILCHCAAHLIADGDLTGGLRNLWDFHCIANEMQKRTSGKYWHDIYAAPGCRHLYASVMRAARLSHHLYGTHVYPKQERLAFTDYFFIHRLTARDGWGRPTRKWLRFIFYIRSHLLRMPPLMLVRHLWVKWRKGQPSR